MKHPRILWLALALALLLCVAPLTYSRADFGDYAGDSDFGGGGYSGDYDDYDSSGGDGGGFSFTAGVVLFIIIIILVYFEKKKGTGSGNVSGPSGVDRSALTPMSEYLKLDPAFAPSALEAKIANLYIQMQQCWQQKDISSLRPYFSNMFFEQADRQLEAHRDAKRTNYVKNPTVLSVTLLGFRQEGGMDMITAEVKARIIDYTLDDATGKLLSGNMTAEKFMTYEWELIRPTGQTTKAPDELTTISCPHCGAPVNVNQSAKCEYCGSVLTVDQYDFVLNKITAISQQTVG